MSGNTLRIGEIAEATGVAPRLLRYYEEQGLLSPRRSPTGQRLYSLEDLESVRRVRRLLAAGLSTTVIARIVACACDGARDVEPCLDPLIREEMDRIDARLAALTEYRERLATLLDTGRAPAMESVTHDPALLLTRV